MNGPTLIYNEAAQNTPEWLKAREGVITASIAKYARERSDGLTAQQRAYVNAALLHAKACELDPAVLLTDSAKEIRRAAAAVAGYKNPPVSDLVNAALSGKKLPLAWSDGAITVARDLARQRVGGCRPTAGTTGFAARVGHEEEASAVLEYRMKTGYECDEVGFVHTADRKFGCSLDRKVRDQPGAVEVKTMVSSGTLWDAWIGEDISAYRDQCLMQMWLWTLDWVDLALWIPDLFALKVIRIERDEAAIDALVPDLLAFDELVDREAQALAQAVGIPYTPATLDAPDGSGQVELFTAGGADEPGN